MTCAKCGEEMHLMEKDTSSGRDIREYKCSECGYSDWEDRGKALWQILSDDRRERDEAAQANVASDNSPDVHSLEPEPSPASSLWDRLLALLTRFHKRKP
jgi:DNA-directed RNA polymerase subunit M/transcription elongation factor TFIIS